MFNLRSRILYQGKGTKPKTKPKKQNKKIQNQTKQLATFLLFFSHSLVSVSRLFFYFILVVWWSIVSCFLFVMCKLANPSFTSSTTLFTRFSYYFCVYFPLFVAYFANLFYPFYNFLAGVLFFFLSLLSLFGCVFTLFLCIFSIQHSLFTCFFYSHPLSLSLSL